MRNKCQLSDNTKTYVEQYRCILSTMIDNMSSDALTDSISGSFIAQMIPHHYGAIQMSENLLRYTTNIPLQCIAQNIITSQKKSIENMTVIYPKCRNFINTQQELCCYQEKNERILKNMFQEMSSACTDNNINANFIREMIPHHKGAVYMSENALCYPLCCGLVPLLEEIIVSQKRGICKMQQLLKNIH